jgi:8-oxo-dGTP pyrophosphatase MutT (NUDIX family)
MSSKADDLARVQQILAQHQPLQLGAGHPEAAVLVALSDQSHGPELLLTRRARHMAIHSGEVAFPGGKHEQADKSLLHTALREAEEEVALPQSSVQYAGRLNQRMTRSNIIVTPYVGLIPPRLDLKPNLNEVDSLFYTPVEFFLDPANLHIDTVRYQGQLRHIPRFDFQQYTIWGVTAMIIVDLMNTVFDADLPLANTEGE